MPTATQFVHDLFVPLPEPANAEKDHVDHVADYTDSAKGAWDVFRVIDYSLSYAKMFPMLAKELKSQIEKVQEVAGSAGIGLSIPKLVSDANSLRHSLTNLYAVKDLPPSDPLRTRKVAQAAKKSFLDAIDLTWTLSQVATFIHSAKIYIFNALQLKAIDGVNNVTSLISDGSELITECCKLKDHDSVVVRARTPAETAKAKEQKRLTWILIAKNVASVSTAVIAIVGIVFGIALQSIPLIVGAVLVLNTVWLAMKLAGHFYKKIVIEAPLVVAT